MIKRILLTQMIAILLLPLRLIYFLGIKPILLFILKGDLEKEKEKYKNLMKDFRRVNDELSIEQNLNRLHNCKTNRLKVLIKHYIDYETEFDITENDEVVIIFSPSKKHLDSFYLCGIDGTDKTNDCRIYLINFRNELKIVDIISNTRNRGYAKTLLNYTINKAKINGIERIYGELSPVDNASFEWLIPFYESLGFRCKLSNEKENGGYLELKVIHE